ncbi:MAG: VacJ family lipoprotein [Desulfobacterales bacterium]
MQDKIKRAIFFTFLLAAVLTSQSFAGEPNFLTESHDPGFSSVIAQSDFSDDDFYFPDDLAEEETQYHLADPLRPFNVAMFHFNDKLYFWLLKPVAQGWRTVVPEIARKGIRNFFNNLGFPIRFVNSLLQLKPDKAAGELGSFLLNSTFGALGFANLSKKFYGFDPDAEDLGQTFGRYGIGHGFYLVLPVFGPSSLRDGIGIAGDSFLDPVFYVDPWELRAGAGATDTVNRTSFRIGDYEAFKDAALEPYDAMKSGYLQRRLESVNK